MYSRATGGTSTTLVPFLPARPVRPLRCVKASASPGGSAWMTRATSGTSSPRAATSVATSTVTAPARKAPSVLVRSHCSSSPWSGRAEKPEAESASAISEASARVRTNTSARSAGARRRRFTSAATRSSGRTRWTTCSMSALAWPCAVPSTRAASRW